MNPNQNHSCPKCGKAGPGKVREEILRMKCPVHGTVRHNYETNETEIL